MSIARNYDFNSVILLIGGVPITGFADGDAISVDLPERFTTQVGAGGATTRSKRNDRTATLTIRLQQSSPSNDVLSGYAKLDDLTGKGVVPALLKDLNGRDLLAAPQAWIEQMPGPTFGAESGVREWVLRLANTELWAGGATAA